MFSSITYNLSIDCVVGYIWSSSITLNCICHYGGCKQLNRVWKPRSLYKHNSSGHCDDLFEWYDSSDAQVIGDNPFNYINRKHIIAIIHAGTRASYLLLDIYLSDKLCNKGPCLELYKIFPHRTSMQFSYYGIPLPTQHDSHAFSKTWQFQTSLMWLLMNNLCQFVYEVLWHWVGVIGGQYPVIYFACSLQVVGVHVWLCVCWCQKPPNFLRLLLLIWWHYTHNEQMSVLHSLITFTIDLLH